MTTAASRKLHTTYLKRIQRCCIEMPCLVCRENIKVNMFRHHFETNHDELKNTCCWCLNYSWPPNEKMQHTQHLLDCFNRLLNSVQEKLKHSDRQAEIQSASSSSEDLNRFQNKLAAISKTCHPYACPEDSCSERVRPCKMEKHFKMEHSPFDPAVSCVWCKGAFVWPRGEKNLNVKHLKKCFKKIRKREEMANCSRSSLQPPELPPLPQPSASTEKIVFTSEDCFLWVRNMMGRSPVLAHFEDTYKPLLETIHYTVFPRLPDSRGVIPFQSGCVETARFYSDMYRQHHHLLEQVEKDRNDDSDKDEETVYEMKGAIATWYHVMISAYALEKFVRALKDFGEEKVFTLPFWCWCDGGRYEKDVFRHHRHMILVVRNGYDFIAKCWRKLSRIVHNKQYKKKNAVVEEILPEPEPLPEGFYMGRSKNIRTWKHLLNVMRYVSSPESKCRYDFKGDYTLKNKKRKRERRHFFIWSGWHPHAMPSLVSTAANGFKMLLDQENKFKLSKSLDPECVFRWPAENGPWHIRVGDLVKKKPSMVLPVEKCWQPVRLTFGPVSGREAYLYLLNGKKLVFGKNEALESLSEEEWQRVQERGCGEAKNMFYDAMAHDFWKLNRNQQNALNFAEKFGKRVDEKAEKRWKEILAERDSEWQCKLAERDSEWRCKLAERDSEWQSKMDVLRKEIELLKKQFNLQDEEGVSNKRKRENDRQKSNIFCYTVSNNNFHTWNSK